MVLPILSYGGEMWGYEQIASIERVHIGFLKIILKGSITTCDEAVLGEVGVIHSVCIVQSNVYLIG